MPEAKYIAVPDGINSTQVFQRVLLAAHAPSVLTHHGFECVGNILFSDFSSGELEENIFQTRAVQTYRLYFGAKFFNKSGQKFITVADFKEGRIGSRLSEPVFQENLRFLRILQAAGHQEKTTAPEAKTKTKAS